MSQSTAATGADRTTVGRLARARRGAATFWLIVSLPVFIILFIVLIDLSNLWLARVELENALEAAALAAVKEWAESGGGPAPGWTLQARNVGVGYAAANTASGQPVIIGTNLGTFANPGNPNENKLCDVVKGPPPDGNLIFGALIDFELPIQRPVIFDANEIPSCGLGTVLFDASGQGSLGSGPNTNDHHKWGIRFLDEPDLPPGILIEEARIELPAGAGFFDTDSFEFADDIEPDAVTDNSMLTPRAPDVFGLVTPAMDPNPANHQIEFAFSGGDTILTFTFDANATDVGFEPGDRFRFAVKVTARPGGGGANSDGDEIGEDNVRVFVRFNNGTTAEGVFVDTQSPKMLCLDPGIYDAAHQSLTVSPVFVPGDPSQAIPDLPCPPSAALTNDGQSYVQLSGRSDRPFAVRAQASIPVESLFCKFCGIDFGPYCVSAKTTAVYICEQQRPRLIIIDEFRCAPGAGADPP